MLTILFDLKRLPILLLFLFSPLFAGGCPPGPPTACPFAELEPSDAEEGGVVQWAFGEDFGDGPPEESPKVEARRGQSPYPFIQRADGDRVSLNDWVRIVLSTDGGGVTFTAPLGDPRDWQVGPVSISPAHRQAVGPNREISLQFSEPDCERNCSCQAYIDGIEVEVLEAEGEKRPFPELVTPDFRRTYRVLFEEQEIVGYRIIDREVPCSAALTLSFDLLFEITADHIVVRPNGMCEDGTPTSY